MGFFNPALLWFALGGAVPVIIHLLHRQKFKRMRWAAMEFLLKSQKRNRRRLIIEQLILLALRCLLVFLTAVLLARFLGFSFAAFQPRNTLHVVILDDRLSTEDRWRTEDGELKVAASFSNAPEQLWRLDQLADGSWRIMPKPVKSNTNSESA